MSNFQPQPILVTGSHRSGSTWVGKMLASHPQIGYIQEPFNVKHYPSKAGICPVRFTKWYTYVKPENEASLKGEILDTFKFSYNLKAAFSNLIRPQIDCNLAKESVKIIRDYLFFEIYKRKKVRPLMKDPIAFFSAEWLTQEFIMDTIVLIRHPAAFAGSLKVANWSFPFSHFLNQTHLMEDYLFPFREEIEQQVKSESLDIISQASLLWKIIHSVILSYQRKYSDWIFIRYEDLALNPTSGFGNLFERINLDYPNSVKQYIEKYNTSSQSLANHNRAARKMNSSANINSWKQRLTNKEIDQVRESVEEVAKHFYSDEDW